MHLTSIPRITGSLGLFLACCTTPVVAQSVDLSVHGFRSDVTVPINDLTKRSLEYPYLLKWQASAMDFSARVGNQGPDTAINVVVILEAVFPGIDLGTFVSDTIPQLVPGDTDTLVIHAGLDVAGGDATLSLRFTVSSDQMDEIISNNNDTVLTRIGDYFFHRTDGFWTDTISLTEVGTALGVRYEFQEEDLACGISCVVPYTQEPMDGVLVGSLFDAEMNFLVGASEIQPGPWDMSEPGEQNWVTLYFDEPYELQAGQDYYAVVEVFLNAPPWGFAAAGECPDSSAFRIDLDSGVLTWLDRTPVIGLVGQGCEFGIGENTMSGLVLENCSPNPASGSTSFRYSTAVPGGARFELKNALGELVGMRSLPSQSVGTHVLEFDVSDLTAGVYSYSVYLDGTKATRRMVVVH